MRPLSALDEEQARSVETLVFDLDDTLLDHGQLLEEAYASLFRLRDAGLMLLACTGRPSGWAELVARQWPIHAAIAENGALVWARAEGGRTLLADPVPTQERAARRARLAAATSLLLAAHPELSLADDNAARLSDVTFDIGEHQRVAPAVVAAARARASELGLRSFESSVHLHITLDGHDKASGFLRWMRQRGVDPVRALGRGAFVGDSANDAAAFAAFRLTFAVRNVEPHLGSLTVPPRFVASQVMGKGFAEIAARLCELRR